MATRLVEISVSDFGSNDPTKDAEIVRVPRRLLDEMIKVMEVALHRIRCSSDGSEFSDRLLQATEQALLDAQRHRARIDALHATRPRQPYRGKAEKASMG